MDFSKLAFDKVCDRHHKAAEKRNTWKEHYMDKVSPN